MESGAFAYSHLLGKTVWGHQARAALNSDGETALCYKRCGKNDAGKIEQAADIASSLPMAERLSYALMDSWYTCPMFAGYRIQPLRESVLQSRNCSGLDYAMGGSVLASIIPICRPWILFFSIVKG